MTPPPPPCLQIHLDFMFRLVGYIDGNFIRCHPEPTPLHTVRSFGFSGKPKHIGYDRITALEVGVEMLDIVGYFIYSIHLVVSSA